VEIGQGRGEGEGQRFTESVTISKMVEGGYIYDNL